MRNENNVLPLNASKSCHILVVGENAIKMMTVGGGSSSLKVQREVLPYDGICNMAKNVGCTVEYARGYVGDVTGAYNGVTTGQDLTDNRSPEELIADAVAKAKKADYVVFVGGLTKANIRIAKILTAKLLNCLITRMPLSKLWPMPIKI